MLPGYNITSALCLVASSSVTEKKNCIRDLNDADKKCHVFSGLFVANAAYDAQPVSAWVKALCADCDHMMSSVENAFCHFFVHKSCVQVATDDIRR